MRALTFAACLVAASYALTANQTGKKIGTNPNCDKEFKNEKNNQQACKNGAGASVHCCEPDGTANPAVTEVETAAATPYVCVARQGECRPQCPDVYMGEDGNSLDVYWTEDQGYCKDSTPEKTLITLFDWGTHGGLPMNDLERHVILVHDGVQPTGTS